MALASTKPPPADFHRAVSGSAVKATSVRDLTVGDIDVVFQPKQMTPEELENGHLELMKQVYSEKQFLKRKRHYVDIMKLKAAG